VRDLRVLIVGFVAATVVGAAAAAAPAQTVTVLEGKQQYDTCCASCHGTAGKGDGAMAKSLKKPRRSHAARTEEWREVPGRDRGQVH